MSQVFYDGAMRDTISAFQVRREIKARDGVSVRPGGLSDHLLAHGNYFESLGGWVERGSDCFVVIGGEPDAPVQSNQRSPLGPGA